MEKEYSVALAEAEQGMSKAFRTDDYIGYMQNYMRAFLDTYAKQSVRSFYINCWHINEYESEAMWKLYTKGREGIAVQSTVGRLIDSANKSQEAIFIGQVKYMDYNKDSFRRGNHLNAIVCKRQSFAHEQELRAVIYKHEVISNMPECEYVKRDDGSTILKIPDFSAGYKDHPHGIYSCICLRQLIQKLYVAPLSPTWFGDLVSTVAKKYGLSCEIERSSLEERPLW